MNRVYSFVENKLMEKVQEIEQDLKKWQAIKQS
jgi:hypothetical protein